MSETLIMLITSQQDIESACNIVREELYMIGYPELPKYENNESLLLHLINLIYTLIKHRKAYVNNKLSSEQGKALLEDNIKAFQKKIENLETKLKVSKSEINKRMNELEKMKADKTLVIQELNNTKIEFQKIQKLLQSRNEEYCNKFRQKEFEIIELQKSLAQKIDLKRSIRNTSNNVTTVAKDNVKTEENDQISMKEMETLNSSSICRYENTITTLVQENINLRNSIELLTKKLQQLYQNIINGSTFKDDEVDISDFREMISEHLFNVPGDNVVKLVEKHVCIVIEKIKDCLKNEPGKTDNEQRTSE